MSEKIKFHDTVITPNGKGVVHALLIQGEKESILVSHNPKDLPAGEVYGKPLLPGGDHQSIWVLYAYNQADVQPMKGGK